MSEQKYYDANAAIQVIGNIFINPNIIAEEHNGFSLYEFDFCSDLHRVIFSALQNLTVKHATDFTINVVEDFLSHKPESFAIYKVNNGATWIDKAISQAEPLNIEYYYNRLKKMTLLRKYSEIGMNVDWIYDADSIDPKERARQDQWLNEHTLADISELISNKVESAKRSVLNGNPKMGQQAGEGLQDLLDSLKKNPIRGYSLFDRYTDEIALGARPGCFYLRSASTGTGKSRTAMADACYLACSEIYDVDKKEWVKNNNQVNSVFLSVELQYEELRTMAVSFVSGIDENIIIGHQDDLTFQEQERLKKAVKIIDTSPLYFDFLPDYSMSDVETKIIQYVTTNYNVKAVFFDYLTSSMSVIQEIAQASAGMKVREDQVLFLLASKIKDIATKFGVFIASSTQLNGTFREAKILDQNVLAGAKSIANRIDFGEIMVDVTQDDLDDVFPVIEAHGITEKPNVKASIYKNRRGKYTRVICWMKADKGTSRYKTLFVTDYDYNWVDIDFHQLKEVGE